MAERLLYVANIARTKVCGDRRWPGVENGRTSGALENVDPFIGIRMPMHFAHAAQLDDNLRRGNRFRNMEVGTIRYPYCSALCFPVRLHVAEPKHEGIGRLARNRRHLRFDGWQRRRWNIALINPSIVQGNIFERLYGHSEILG